ncbi:MAG: hypothetical protein OHK0039_02590 [Bacteroidia bacterium]
MQIVIFGRDGAYIDSCHSLADLRKWQHTSVYEQAPFLIAMRPAIEAGQRVYLPAVDYLLGDMPGFFDFEVYLHPQHPQQCVWLIWDFTDLYKRFRQLQQAHHEWALQDEHTTQSRP